MWKRAADTSSGALASPRPGVRVSWLVATVALTGALFSQGQDTSGSDRNPRRLQRNRFDFETLATTALLESGEVDRYEPTLTALADGQALVAFVELHHGEGEWLRSARLQLGEEPVLDRVPMPPAEICHPRIAGQGGDAATLVWTQIEESGTTLRASRHEHHRWSPPRELRRGAPLLHPELAAGPGESLWLVWQEYRKPEGAKRGQFEVLLAPLGPDALGEPLRVSEGPENDIEPTVLVDSSGKVWIAWTQFQGKEYEVLLRTFDPAEKTFGPPRNISRHSLADDLHPRLARGPGDAVWLTWDALTNERRGSSWPEDDPERRGDEGRIQIARVDAAEVLQPTATPPRQTQPDGNMFSASGALPHLIVAPAGALHLVYRPLLREGSRKVAERSYSYPVILQTRGEESWGEERLLAASFGDHEDPAVAPAARGFWVAWQQDRHADTTRNNLAAPIPKAQREQLFSRGIQLSGTLGPAGIGVVYVPFADVQEGAPTLEARPAVTDARSHPLRGIDTDPFVRGDDHYRIVRDREVYRVYWGDLHRHSSISRCSKGLEPDPHDRYRFGRDSFRYDFYALTDHTGAISPFQWRQLSKWVALYQNPDFVTLQGYEWSTPTFGHVNVLLRQRTDAIVSTEHKLYRSLSDLWTELDPEQMLAIPHHTAQSRFSYRWEQTDPKLVPLVEVYQAMRGSYEFPGCYRQAAEADEPGRFVQDGLAMGVQVGFIASTDHGYGASYAAVLAPELTRESLFDALKARRTYGSTTKGILLDFRLNDALPGETIQVDAAPELRWTVRGVDELAEVTVFRDGKILWCSRKERVGQTATFAGVGTEPVEREPGMGPESAEEWVDATCEPGAHWYYLRVIQRDGEMAWSSPVFVERR